MRASVFLAVVLMAMGCAASAPAVPARAEPLYFAVEVMKSGKRVASPKLVGFAGKQVAAERKQPGAAEPEYQLVLKPAEIGPGYQVALQLSLPSGKSEGQVGLLHGEERSVHLDGDTELKVLLMRVDSPEFRALMSTAPAKPPDTI